MKKLSYLFLTILAVVCVSCKEEHTTRMNEIAKNCFAPGGNNSYWEYHDARSTTERDFTVTETDFDTSKTACDEKKVYSEYISYKLGGSACSVYSNSCTEEGTAVIQVAVPHSEALYLTCDAKGEFNCDTTDYFASYNVNNVEYKKVHYFGVKLGTDYYHYYYAEGIGLIYVYDEQQKIAMKLTGYQIR